MSDLSTSYALLARKVRPLVLAAIVASLYLILAHGHRPIWQERSKMYGANYDFDATCAAELRSNSARHTVQVVASVSWHKRKSSSPERSVRDLRACAERLRQAGSGLLPLFSCAIRPSPPCLARAPSRNSPVQPPPRAARQHRTQSTCCTTPFSSPCSNRCGPRLAGLRPDQSGLFVLLACCVILTVIADRTYAYFENPAARRLINFVSTSDLDRPAKCNRPPRRPCDLTRRSRRLTRRPTEARPPDSTQATLLSDTEPIGLAHRPAAD